MLNHPDHHPRNITQTWKQHNYNNNSTGHANENSLAIQREREVPVYLYKIGAAL